VAEKVVVRSYRDLEVYQLAFEGAVKVHAMTMGLPKYELYEEGSQVRRSAKSIPANIAEGFGRRRYANEYIHYLTIALASCDETRVHLDMMHSVGNLDAPTDEALSTRYRIIGKQLNRFLQSVVEQHVEPYRDHSASRVSEDCSEYTLKAGV
jgi:four helix bundle protein